MFFSKLVQFISSKSKFAKKNSGAELENPMVDEKPHLSSAGESALTPGKYFNVITCTRIRNSCILTGSVTNILASFESPFTQPGFKEYSESGCLFTYNKGYISCRYSARFGISREENGITYRLRGEITDSSGMHKSIITRNELSYGQIERVIINALIADHREDGEISLEPN